MALQTFGGVTLVATAGPLVGRTIAVRGEVKIKSLGGKATIGTNLNGSIYREFEPGAVRFELTYERLQPSLSQADLLAEHDFILSEVDAGRTHYIRNAVLDGEGDDSAKSGEASGLAIVCAAADHDERAS